MDSWDAVVVGAGPNGLAAAVRLARAGLSVHVIERAATIGGGTRTEPLTLPGFVHDVCSAVHPLAAGSPFLSQLPLADHGLQWIQPDAPLAHPLEDRTVTLERSLDRAVDALGRDGARYRDLVGELVGSWSELAPDLLAPLGWPGRPVSLARFGLRALRSADGLARAAFRTTEARALFAGLAAHSLLPLERLASSAAALVLAAAAHVAGWPIARGGSRAVTDALASLLHASGGSIQTGRAVRAIAELSARAIVLDLTPKEVLAVAGARLPGRYRRALERYRYNPGAFKVDWALSEPIPWRDETCARAGTVHLGGSLEEIAASERAAWSDRAAERPFVLLAQPTLFDDSRAPPGRHTAWAYCHVPHGSTEDMTARIEAQVERYAPGFGERILARSTLCPAQLEALNPNMVGGDINGGVQDLWQLFFRPTVSFSPHRTPVPGLYLCSSATPPGGGVHGMCGFHAANAVLEDLGVA